MTERQQGRTPATAVGWMLLGVLAALGLVTAVGVAAEAATVGTVRLEGNQVVPAETILGQVRTRSGAVFSEDLLAEDARRIIIMPQVYDVKFRVTPRDGVVDITFFVTEAPQVKDVRLVGNKNLKTDELMKLLEFGAGDFLDHYLVSHGAEILADYYHEKGYYFAEVNVNEDLLRVDQEVVYVITEGPKLRIKKVLFEGNEAFGRGKLKGKVKTSGYFPIFSKGLLDDSKIEQDRIALTTFYRDEGYLDARVFSEKRFNEDRTRAWVVFVIDEGPKYSIRDIRFEGNEVFGADTLAAELQVESGQAFTKERRVNATKSVSRVMGREGYIYNEVRLEPRYTDEPGEVDAVFEIDEGGQFELGAVIVRGNEQTKEKVVRREFDRYGFLPESIYNTEAMDRGVRRLEGSGLFEEVRVTPIGDDPEERDALVEVTEARTGLLLFGVGIDTNSGLLGQFSFEQRNYDIARYPQDMRDLLTGDAWIGAGQRLRLDFEPGTEVTRGRIKFYEPYLFDQPYYLDVNLFLFRRWRESYLEERKGGQVTVGRRFDNDWSAEIGLRLEEISVSRLDTGYVIPGDRTSGVTIIAPQDVKDVRGDNFLTSTKFGIGRDTTDRLFRPTEGYKFTTHWEQVGALGGDFEFSAVSSGLTTYVPVYEDLAERRTVWASRVQSSWIVVGDAPVFERYYGGGIGSIRGFDYRGVSPRAGRKNDPVGSDYIVLLGTELTHPLYEEVLFGKVFLDSGIIEEGPYRVAAGFGIELLVPQLFQMVPMHFDFAWPLQSDAEDEEEVFSFSIGLTF